MVSRILVLLALPALAAAFMAPSFCPTPLARASLSCARAPALRSTASPLGLTMQSQDDNKLFVGGLPWALDSEDLREVFQEFGEIDQANVVYDRETGRSRGFGFVQFKVKADATKALEAMNQAEIGGRTVNVNFAKAREQRPPRSFSGNNSGGGY